MKQVEADVCVVGAGYAGLTAAWRLSLAGLSVVVLEARDRVGGRVWTHDVGDGTYVDRGAGWIAPKHDAILRLGAEFAVASYKTHTAGHHLLLSDGRTRKYKGLIPKIGPLAITTLAITMARLDRMAKKIPVDAPWDAKKADQWDDHSIAWWLDRTHVRTKVARELLEMSVRGLMTADLNDVSLLHLLLLVRSAGGFGTLTSIQGGYQENLVDGGAIAAALAITESLGDAVRLNAPVRKITQKNDRVTVASKSVTVKARRAVVSVPPALALEIDFDPVLPDDRVRLYTHAIGGPETKTLVVYDYPFWRLDGLSGQSAEPRSAAEVTLDASPLSGRPGVLASFTFGPNAQRLAALDPNDRRREVLRALRERFGPHASSPLEFIETEWWTEEWTRGCSMAHFAPRVLTKYGHLLREPFGRIHWAGTETASTSHGSMDGAVRSGERAAAEILRLRHD